MLGYKLQDLICHTSSIERAYLPLVQTSEIIVVFQIQVHWDGGDDEASEDQIDTDAEKLELDNWDERIRHWCHFFYRSFGCHSFKYNRKLGEEVIDHDMLRRNDEGIDIGSCKNRDENHSLNQSSMVDLPGP